MLSVSAAGALALALAGGCSAKPAATDDRLCTPGANVYCRCANRDEGTKLCNDDGQSFQACQPCPDDPPGTSSGGPSTQPDGGSPPEDGGFVPVDSGPLPDVTGGPPIDDKCIGKLGVLAGSDKDSVTFAAIYKGKGAFDVESSTGPGMQSNAQILPVGTSLLAVWVGKLNSLVSAKYESAWSAPTSFQSTGSIPALTSMGTQAKVVYLGLDGAYYVGTYNAGWDTADTSAEPSGGITVPGKSAPSLAAVGSTLVYAFTGSDNTLDQVSSSGSTFTTPKNLGTAYSAPPALTLMNGGSKDLLTVFTGNDLALHSVTRTASNKTWATSQLIDDTAQTNDPPQVAPLPGGGAIAVWRAVSGQAYYSVFDPAKITPWSPPAELVGGNNPTVTSTPVLAPGKCGADVVAAYSEANGAVSVMHYANGAWTAPYPIGGMTNLTYVGVGELP